MKTLLTRPFLEWAAWCLMVVCGRCLEADEAIVELRDRRELFVDGTLIDRMVNVERVMHPPHDEGPVFYFDQSWEGIHSAYCSVLQHGPQFRLYYRGMPAGVVDGTAGEVTCVALSDDGITWNRPRLTQFAREDAPQNNIVYAHDPPFSHNFSPFFDTNPECPPQERYKALSGLDNSGLVAFVSPDGLTWRKLQNEAVIPKRAPFPCEWMFDSQNVAFWSESEQKYVAYFRVYTGVRRIARCESLDFCHWSEPVLMNYLKSTGDEAPLEELYTNQTFAYFRAPQIYLSIAARFVPNRQVIRDDQAKQLNLAEGYQRDVSDAVLMSTRGGSSYDRSFLTSFIRPGIGAKNWVSRTNYPALGIIPTGPEEISIYTNQDYAQPTAHLHRYSLRTDGFASIRAPYEGGHVWTKPLTFHGDALELNFSTSAVGSVRVEICNLDGGPWPGFKQDDSEELIGNEIARDVSWKSGQSLGSLSGRPVRLHFILQDADVFAFRFHTRGER